MPRTSMSRAIRDRFLSAKRPLVVAGTHGKTTTSALAAWMLLCAGREPGWFIGGVPKNLPAPAALGSPHTRPGRGRTPFVLEGDEYDAVYWDKRPKFLDYVGVAPNDVVVLTSIEHDHVDIYPDVKSYEEAFRALVRAVPGGGLLVCDAHDANVRRIVQEEAKARVTFYALADDATGAVTAGWLGAPATPPPGHAAAFDLFAGGVSCGRFVSRLPGAHNVRNAIAAVAACAEGFAVGTHDLRAALASFEGVRRRQELLGSPRGVSVYDDFAHHPTAVDETLRALRGRHPGGRLWAAFEPRSATACRSLHQAAYVRAFEVADEVLLAPLGRTNVPEGERLDLDRLARELGNKAHAMPDVDAIVARIASHARSGDCVALLSNGAFGGVHQKLLETLGARA
jgi:UDP-N-acetylmuramate: L-alanyl-gamma-D-glutamyl-meso-diaminopimelate ligase